MSAPSSPFGPDTLAAAACLVSDETDPAYLAWRAEHPEAFAAGTWTSASRQPRAMPPGASRSRPTAIDPAATTPTHDILARSDVSTQEFMQIAAAARTGAPAPAHLKRNSGDGNVR